MGKHTDEKQQQEEGSRSDKSNPNRKWIRMLHLLDYHRWNVKKMLPHKKHAEGKDGHESVEGSDENAKVDEKSDLCNGDVCTVKGHACNGDVCTLNIKSSHPEEKAAKKGRAARLRAKIVKDVIWRRVRHRRNSSGQASLDPNAKPATEPAAEIEQTLQSEPPTAVMDTNLGEKTSVGSENVTEKEKETRMESFDEEEQASLLKMEGVKLLGRCSTFQQSRGLLDAMDVLSMNKEFFLKVLENPEASLQRHFIVQRASFKAKGLDRSRTFPRPRPLEAEDSCARFDKRSIEKSFFENRRKSLNHNSLASPRKDLRQKIRHVVKEGKAETNRIAMDSVLHKVPYGRQLSESKKDNIVEQLNKDNDNANSSKMYHSVKRWPSLNESMDRYCKLIEPKNTASSDSVKLRVKDTMFRSTLERMSSSPDLFMCLRSPVTESSATSSSRAPSGIPLPVRVIKASRSFHEFNSQLMLSGFEMEGIEEEVEEALERDDDGVSCEEPCLGSSDDLGTLEKPEMLSEDASSLTPDTTTDVEKQESEPKSLHRLIVQSKDQPSFDYVKCALQLSGFLEQSQALGAWQSQGQPLDPSLFTELEKCSLQEPTFPSPEEDEGGATRCNRLLLFDSVNEVLLSAYERSVSYWNSPLTSCSHIHPMPKGHCVLDQVWSQISWYLNSEANQMESSLDHVIMHDLGEDDGWMNLQFEAEGALLEIESLIFEEVLVEAME